MDKNILAYRKQQKFLYDWKEKYSKLIELDPIKRNAGRLVNFIRKKILYHPFNLSESMINEIPGIYRFRCRIYDTHAEINMLNDIYNSQAQIIALESDASIKSTLIESLKKEIDDQKKNLINSKSSTCYEVLLDLRNYLYVLSDTSNIYVYFDDKIFILDDSTAKRLREQCAKINSKSIKGEQFIQMINHSKALSQTYRADK